MAGHRLDLQRFRDGVNPVQEAEIWMEASRIAAQRGCPAEARRLLQTAIQIRPDWAEAWLFWAQLTEDRQERRALLRRARALQGAEGRGQRADRDGQPEQDRRQPMSRSTPAPGRPPVAMERRGIRAQRWMLSLLALLVVLLLAILAWGPMNRSLAWLLPTPTPVATPTPTLTPAQIVDQFVPRLQAALADRDWERAEEIISLMRAVDPSGVEVQLWAMTTYLQHGQALVETGQIQAAQEQFDRAVALAPGSQEARLWQQATHTYLTGQAALEAKEWAAAIQAFGDLYGQMPGYGDVSARLVEAYCRQAQAAIDGGDWTAAIETLSQAHEQLPAAQEVVDLLALAYRQRGILREERGRLEQARADLEAALALRPGDAEAQAHLDRVMYRLFPPKRIEIDISQQHFYAWEGDTLVFSFPTSTGLPGQDTAIGHFQVLDKMPMAYSSVWHLKMPYWLGIYYVGNIENGIHGLPIRPDGSVMWGGLLGQRASYGCVILSTEAARLVYDWAEIGTVVDIHY